MVRARRGAGSLQDLMSATSVCTDSAKRFFPWCARKPRSAPSEIHVQSRHGVVPRIAERFCGVGQFRSMPLGRIRTCAASPNPAIGPEGGAPDSNVPLPAPALAKSRMRDVAASRRAPSTTGRQCRSGGSAHGSRARRGPQRSWAGSHGDRESVRVKAAAGLFGPSGTCPIMRPSDDGCQRGPASIKRIQDRCRQIRCGDGSAYPILLGAAIGGHGSLEHSATADMPFWGGLASAIHRALTTVQSIALPHSKRSGPTLACSSQTPHFGLATAISLRDRWRR